MEHSRITIGDHTFSDSDIEEADCYLENSLPGDELSVNTLEATVHSLDAVDCYLYDCGGNALSDSSGSRLLARPRTRDLTQYQYGEPVCLYHDGLLVGKFYRLSIVRQGMASYSLSCVSGIGLLDKTKHYGGLYTGQPLREVLADIIGGLIPYSVEQEWSEIPVYNWLPIGTRRENLHQLLFAMGLSVQKDGAGDMRIAALKRAEPKEITDDRLDADGTMEQRSPSIEVVVTEHAYAEFANDERMTLFSGECAAENLRSPKGDTLSGVLVPFDGPMHSLSVAGGEVLESGVNYAVLARASDCQLTGQRYTHTTRQIILSSGQGKSEEIIPVEDSTLVSLANSENVASRVLAYYSATKLIQSDMVVGAERPGDAVSLTDPFWERTDAIIQSMAVRVSNLMVAATVFVQGYIPTGIGNYYSHVAVIAQDCVWRAPPESKGKVRFVHIGGGDGGEPGERGGDGTGSQDAPGTNGGAGGLGGKAGGGGKIYVITVPVAVGQQFNVHIGAGGTGGTADQAPTVGGATTVGPYSSEMGSAADKGYADQFGGGAVYALPGAPGVDGGAGSSKDTDGPAVEFEGAVYYAGKRGARRVLDDGSCYGYGGGGGGAAVGGNGSDGKAGSLSGDGMGGIFANGGDAGNGAPGAQGRGAIIPGSGGSGGHGGGGGGAGGQAKGSASNKQWQGAKGAGASGGRGGDGAKGIVIVYW